MTGTTTVRDERLARSFVPTERGVLALADGLIAACEGRRMRFEHEAGKTPQEGKCRVRWTDGAEEVSAEFDLPRSAFRAALARIAFLCDEHDPAGDVSPYGGTGVVASVDPPGLCRATFENNQQHELFLELEWLRTE